MKSALLTVENIDTIFALSSGGLPSGVAVIRVSGSVSAQVFRLLSGHEPEHNMVKVSNLYDPADGTLLDKGVILYFDGPNSFTGEDCCEFQIHGGKAVVSKFLEVLSTIPKMRMAGEGEFSRRAFENGKLDLTEIEGLSDLLSSETEAQRRQAVAHADGHFRKMLESWRSKLIECRAFLEAEFDFSDEDDVPDTMRRQIRDVCESLVLEIRAQIDNGVSGEIVRNGLVVSLLGPPNSGKSSLLNKLAGRDIAITSSIAGTTRDVLECRVDLDGYQIILRDTAGIRDSEDEIEQEGIRRAFLSANSADLNIWLSPIDDPVDAPTKMKNLLVVQSKIDLADGQLSSLGLETISNHGLDSLLESIKLELGKLDADNIPLITRERHRVELVGCVDCLNRCLDLLDVNGALAAEDLRLASDHIGRLTGRVDVEDLLDIIFSKFCVGK